jgi:hypothetical protein
MCHNLYRKDFAKAEDTLLNFVDKVNEVYEQAEQTVTEELVALRTVIGNFNVYYKAWLRDETGSTEIIPTTKESNVLLDNVYDTYSLYDILWTLEQKLIDNPKQYVLESVRYSLSCYQKLSDNVQEEFKIAVVPVFT